MSYPWDFNDSVSKILEDMKRVHQLWDLKDPVSKMVEDMESVRRTTEPYSDSLRQAQRSLDIITPHENLQRLLRDQLPSIPTSELLAAAAVGSQAQLYLDDLSKQLTRHEELYADVARQYKRDAQMSEYLQQQYRLDTQTLEVTRLALALEQAIGPLPAIDFSGLISVSVPGSLDFSALDGMLARMNTAIGEAAYVAEAHFEAWERGDEPDQREDAQADLADAKLESRLIEVVPARVLERLKTVDFVPVTLLDQILRSPESMRALTARDFERFIATLIDRLGFHDVVITPRSGDQGRDVLATKTLHGIPILFAFECKRYRPDSPVGPDILRALLGTITHGPTKANKGVLVTTSTFTSGARTFILTEPALDGKDFDGISGWLKEYASQGRLRHASGNEYDIRSR